jgi:hypothetical protein
MMIRNSWVSVILFGVSAQALAGGPLPVPSFDAPARAAGTYQVTSVVVSLDSGRSDRCQPSKGTYPDSRCGKYLWVVRNGRQLALIEAQGAQDSLSSYYSGILDGDFIRRKCDSSVGKESALRGGLFSGNFCRAYQGGQSPDGIDRFLFGTNVPELAKLPAKGSFMDLIGAVTLTFTSNTYSVDLPHGEESPKTISLYEVDRSVNLMIAPIPLADSYSTKYTLTYVSN